MLADVTITPNVDAYIGVGAHIGAGGSIGVQGRHNFQNATVLGANTARAYAQAPGVSLLAGNGAKPTATSSADVDAQVGDVGQGALEEGIRERVAVDELAEADGLPEGAATLRLDPRRQRDVPDALARCEQLLAVRVEDDGRLVVLGGARGAPTVEDDAPVRLVAEEVDRTPVPL